MKPFTKPSPTLTHLLILCLSLSGLLCHLTLADKIVLGTRYSNTSFVFGGSKNPSVPLQILVLPKASPAAATFDIKTIQPQNYGSGELKPLQGGQLELQEMEIAVISPGIFPSAPLSLFLYDTKTKEVLVTLAGLNISLALSGGVVNTNSSGGFSFQPYRATLFVQQVYGEILGKLYEASDLSIDVPNSFIPRITGVAVLQALELQISAEVHGRVVISEVLNAVGGKFQNYVGGAGTAYIDYTVEYFATGLLPPNYLGPPTRRR